MLRWTSMRSSRESLSFAIPTLSKWPNCSQLFSARVQAEEALPFTILFSAGQQKKSKKMAGPEDLAGRLNAMFNEPGPTTTIQRSDRGLSDYSMDSGSTTSSSSQTGQTTTSQADYRPWWTTGRQNIDEEPISNVIGRIRFVPDPRTKSILVLSPPEFIDNIVTLIEELDIPGKQVMIKAIIMQIDHSNVTSLGLQLKSGSFDVGGKAEYR